MELAGFRSSSIVVSMRANSHQTQARAKAIKEQAKKIKEKIANIKKIVIALFRCERALKDPQPLSVKFNATTTLRFRVYFGVASPFLEQNRLGVLRFIYMTSFGMDAQSSYVCVYIE